MMRSYRYDECVRRYEVQVYNDMMILKLRVLSCKIMYEEDLFFFVDVIDFYEKFLWFVLDIFFQEVFIVFIVFYLFIVVKV